MADSTPPSHPERQGLSRRVGGMVAAIDRFVVDGMINTVGFLVFAAAEGLRSLETGKAQLALLGALALLVVTLVAVMLGLPNFWMGALTAGGGRC